MIDWLNLSIRAINHTWRWQIFSTVPAVLIAIFRCNAKPGPAGLGNAKPGLAGLGDAKHDSAGLGSRARPCVHCLPRVIMAMIRNIGSDVWGQ